MLSADSLTTDKTNVDATVMGGCVRFALSKAKAPAPRQEKGVLMSTQVIIRSTSKKGTYMVHGGGFGLVRVVAYVLEKGADGMHLVVKGVHAFNGIFGHQEMVVSEKDLSKGGLVKADMRLLA
jgi:metal-dependent hydrolase (beta-lactamase superfamily II)